jgi:hypothetical protein
MGMVVMICAICDRDPCPSPSFCAACRDADARKARGEPPRCVPLRPTPPPIELPKANLEGKGWKEIAAEAWDGPSWKQAALEYHHARGGRTLTVETPPESLKRLRRLMDLTFEQAQREITKNRPTPPATVEAVIVTVRERGLAALKEPANVERLERCDAAAKAEIERRIAKLRKD